MAMLMVNSVEKNISTVFSCLVNLAGLKYPRFNRMTLPMEVKMACELVTSHGYGH